MPNIVCPVCARPVGPANPLSTTGDDPRWDFRPFAGQMVNEPANGAQCSTPSEQAHATCDQGASAAEPYVASPLSDIVDDLAAYAGRTALAQRALDILAAYPGLAELIDILADLDL